MGHKNEKQAGLLVLQKPNSLPPLVSPLRVDNLPANIRLAHRYGFVKRGTRQVGLEPTTTDLAGRRSVRLSYWRKPLHYKKYL